MNKIQNWSSFSNSLQFGQSFAATAIGKEQNQSKKEEKISFYLQKYMVRKVIDVKLAYEMFWVITTLQAIIYENMRSLVDKSIPGKRKNPTVNAFGKNLGR